MLTADPNSEAPSGGTEAQKSLTDEIEEYVSSLLEGYIPYDIKEPKVIHDPILGSNIFEPYEIALIDSPFCQRLRRISQTDVASLVYPSASHNRLEHSLGVATIAGRILNSLKRDPDLRNLIQLPAEVIEVRFAAILHDIGTGPFSHLSEEVFCDFPEVEQYRLSHKGKFSPKSPHEMLGYMIINSASFKAFVKEQIVGKYKLGEIEPKRIAELIIPTGGKNKLNKWKADIINGPFDADKFDYLQRDAYFSGLRLGIDLDRFLYCVWLDPQPNGPRQLKIMTSGATTVEQILFAKLLLYSSVYHHQKIRAAECAIRGIFEILNDHPDNPEYRIHGRKMNRAIDFLYVTEEDILSLDNKPEELKVYIQQFLNRQLFKRALVISEDTVIDAKNSPGYFEFKLLAEKPDELRELRRTLVESLNRKYSTYEIWIDLPETLTFEDASRAVIQDKGGEPRQLAEYEGGIFRVDEWLTAYGSNKWKGYVFCPAGEAVRKEVGERAAELISDRYHFSFKMPEAANQAKIR